MSNWAQGRAEAAYYTPNDDTDVPMQDCGECSANGCEWCDNTGQVELQQCEFCQLYRCRCDADYDMSADK